MILMINESQGKNNKISSDEVREIVTIKDVNRKTITKKKKICDEKLYNFFKQP